MDEEDPHEHGVSPWLIVASLVFFLALLGGVILTLPRPERAEPEEAVEEVVVDLALPTEVDDVALFTPQPEDEEAWVLVREAVTAYEAGETETAWDRLEELEAAHPGSRAYAAGRRLAGEMLAAEEADEIVEIRGTSTTRAEDVTLMVFWEEWCPECRLVLPVMYIMREAWKGRGLDVLTVTRVTPPSTEAKVEAFLARGALDLPVRVDDGALSTRYGITAVPTAVALREGRVLWQGHPAQINEAMIRSWVGSD